MTDHLRTNSTHHTPRARRVLGVFGDYWADVDEPMPAAVLVATLTDIGSAEGAARAAVARLAGEHLLAPLRNGRRVSYRLTSRAATLVQREARALDSFGASEFEWDGLWSILAFSIPETRRTLRHSVRSQLQGMGYVPLYRGVWVSPWGSASKAMVRLRELGVDEVTAMRATVDAALVDKLHGVWRLGDVRRMYGRLSSELTAGAAPRSGAAALAERSRLAADWQDIRAADMSLPAQLLPADWPRPAVRRAFARRYNELAPWAEDALRRHVASVSPELVPKVTARRLREC